jgi:hypothetical protein
MFLTSLYSKSLEICKNSIAPDSLESLSNTFDTSQCYQLSHGAARIDPFHTIEKGRC